jgi:hypothetical protein
MPAKTPLKYQPPYFRNGPEREFLVIVTNKHAVEHLVSCSFLFHKRYIGKPDYEHTIPVAIDDFPNAWIAHPTEDFAIIAVSNYFNILADKGTPPYCVKLNHTNIPSQDTINELSPIEDIVTVGYPETFMDAEHNIPLFHTGHTATSAFLPFKTSITDANYPNGNT